MEVFTSINGSDGISGKYVAYHRLIIIYKK